MTDSTSLRVLLDLLGHGSAPGDHTVVSHRPVGGAWRDQSVPSDEAAELAEGLERSDVWFAVNPFPAGARRESGKALRLAALYADLDLGDGKLETPEAVAAVIEALTKALGQAPAIVVESGGGGRHPYWPLADPPSGPEAAALLKRFGLLVRKLAADQGGAVDAVWDLARVLRAPGTLNWKYDPPRPVTGQADPEDLPLTVAEVTRALDDAGLDEAPTRKATGYDGPDFDGLTAPRQEQARRHVEVTLDWWRKHLADALTWDADQRDDRGRGWEKLAADLAWALAKEAVAPYAPPFDPEQTFHDLLPEEMAADPLCRGKWRDGLLGKAADRPADPPPWVTHPGPEDDFEPWEETAADDTPVRGPAAARLDWHALFADETEDEFISYPLLPARRQVAIYSPPKVGKSLLLLEMAVAIVNGRPFLGQPTQQTRVLYVDFENDPRGDIRTRLRDMGVGPDELGDLVYLSFPNMAAMNTKAGGRQLVDYALEEECTVIVVDTVSRAVEGEENSNDTWNALYLHTGLLLKQHGLAMIRLDHTGKDEDKGARGGSAKNGDVDAVWSFKRLGGGETFALDCTHKRFALPAGDDSMVIRRETGPLRHEAQGRATAGPGGFRTLVLEKIMAELAALPEGHVGATRTFIRAEVGAASKECDLALDWLVNEGYVSRVTKGTHKLHHLIKPYMSDFEAEPDQPD